MAYPGGFSGCPEPPPSGHDFFYSGGWHRNWHRSSPAIYICDFWKPPWDQLWIRHWKMCQMFYPERKNHSHTAHRLILCCSSHAKHSMVPSRDGLETGIIIFAKAFTRFAAMGVAHFISGAHFGLPSPIIKYVSMYVTPCLMIIYQFCFWALSLTLVASTQQKAIYLYYNSP